MGVDFRWYSDQDQVVCRSEPPHPTRRLVRRLIALALVLLVAQGAVAWRAYRGLQAARADLERLVGQEVWALRAGRRDELLSLLDDSYTPWIDYQQQSFARTAAWFAAQPAASPRVERVSLERGTATVEIVLRHGQTARRAMWRFRQVDGQWRHAPPPDDSWASRRDLESAHVTVRACALDQAAAIRVLPALDDFFVELAHSYWPEAIADPAAGSTRQTPTVIDILPFGGTTAGTEIVSPRLALEFWTEAERDAFLERSGRLAVARVILNHSLHRTWPRPADWWLLEGLALHLAGAWQPEWQSAVQAALAKGAIENYLDVDVYARPAPWTWERYTVPTDAERLHPLACTLGEYLAATYSSQQLAQLVRAVSDETMAWDALASVLGTSRQSLARAWAAYLQRRYGAG